MNDSSAGAEVLDQVLESLSAKATRAAQSILQGVSTVRNKAHHVVCLGEEFATKSEGGKDESDGEEQLLQAFESMSPLISSIAQSTRGLHSGAFLEALEDSDNILIEMRMISVMLKIDAASQSGADNAISSFASRFSDLTQQLQIEIDKAKKIGTLVQKHIGAAQLSINAAQSQTQMHAARIKDLFSSSDSLLQARNEAFQRINHETGNVTKSCHISIQILLPCVQFSDAFSQRSGNASKILKAAEEYGPDAIAAARWLVTAQLIALAKDTDHSRSRSDEALDAIYSAAFRCQQFLTGKDDLLAVATVWLESKARATKDAEMSCDTLNDVFLDTFRQVDLVLDQGNILIDQIRTFDQLAQRMGIEATNGWIAGVRVDRANPGRMATTYLAGEVKARDIKLSEILANCGNALHDTNAAMTSIDRKDIHRALGIMSDIKSAIVADLAKHSRTKDELAGLSDEVATVLRDLVSACKSAREIGRTMGQFSADLIALIAQINQVQPADLAAVDMEWARPIYTTTEERDVHDAMFGAAQVAEVESDIFGDDDDDMAGFVM